ncbi:MAG: UDP-N-acetylmuramoyl-L-alanyl-D-glutamate--2,6-diaminopimelate ligase [Pelagibacterales bacterium MED-G43]|nr:MAG: UDP-N-acetylmuramoyl-L-alanyl-D-glutamate--2,6-diaminopimelate ligase [Pelagibacterales bacterium MED-G43]
MLLKNLIKNISKDKKDIIVTGLSTNSKAIKKNFIFFAIKGSAFNGERFIKEAVKKGASVVICSKSCKFKDKKVSIIKTKDVRYFLSKIASKFYNLKPKNIIAVTGTNGKTSVADIFYQILRINNIPVATIGTLGIKFNNKIIKSNLTSPDTITLHKQLYYLKKKKIDNVIIETSSHGLDQKRLHHLKFKGGIFTNFSQDHLDYHKTMKSYLNAKLILFKEILSKKSVIISDSKIKPFNILKEIAKKNKLKLQDIREELIKIKKFSIKYKSDFKIKNLAMAIKAAKLCGLKEKSIYKTLKKLKDVDGRLELVRKFSNNIKVFIDYAHTPDALLKTLQSLKSNYISGINLVFGCGGDRDKKKRKIMAKIANNNCKKIYVTDDNPRNEDPKKIRNHLLKYIKKNKAFNIGSRALAIKTAIQNADPNEIILIAGKGHEEHQVYKNKKLKISDKKIVKKINLKFLYKNEKQKNYFENRLIFKKIFRKEIPVNFNGLTIDTRTLKKDNLFLSIKGKNHDGNEFIYDAIKKGAGCIVSSSIIKKKNKKIIKTKNVISFLNHFAKLKREFSSAKIIAITGSAGKTSLKNMLNDLLKVFGKTSCSPRSFNNHLGVPISLSNLNHSDEFGIFEVGMSKAGEIKKLSHLIRPHIGVITNIGEAHLENFKNVSEIAKAKSEIIENIETGGTIVLNRDDKFFNYLSKKAKTLNLKILTFGINKNSDIRLKKITKEGSTSKIFIIIGDQKLNLRIGDLNIFNILSSIAILKELGLNISAIKNKFKDIEPSEGRGKKYSISRFKKKFKLIDESYNASPLSVKNAIQKLSMIKNAKFKKFLILGDMLELGSKSIKYHKDLSKVINNSDIDKVFIKGKKTIFTYKHLNKDKRGNILQNIEDIDLSLNGIISNNDYLMIKGSNATGLNDYSKKMIKGI